MSTHTAANIAFDRSAAIAEWQRKIGREVPDEPTAECFDSSQRRATAQIILEEALELIDALGCQVLWESSDRTLTGAGSAVACARGESWGTEDDLVHAAREAADLAYSTECVPVMLGLPFNALFRDLHESNLSRILPDGTWIRHPERNNDERYRRPEFERIIAEARRGSEHPAS